jgi:hypothetical protein
MLALVIGNLFLIKYPGASSVYLWQYVIGLALSSIALSVALTGLGAVYRKLFTSVSNTYMSLYTSGG